MIHVHQFPCLSDNYGYLVHDTDSHETAAIDTPDATEYLRQADQKGWRITQIWNTHWHPDHAGGNETIKAATGCTITGPAEVEGKFPIDRVIAHGDTVKLGNATAQVIETPGHTANHLAFALEGTGMVFSGDHVMGWASTLVSPPDGDMAAYMDSLSRLSTRPWARFLPGHGEVVEDPATRLTELTKQLTERIEALTVEMHERIRHGLPPSEALQPGTSAQARAQTPP